MTIKIIVVNDDSHRQVEVDTIGISADKFNDDPNHKIATVTQQDTIQPRDHKEFWLHGAQYISVKEK